MRNSQSGVTGSSRSTMTCSLRMVTSGRPKKISAASIISVSSKSPVTGMLKKYRPITSTQVSVIRQNSRMPAT